MARNCEKKVIGLNRMYIKKHQEEERTRNPKRPSLSTLHASQDIKKWIPGIKKELDYCLEQLSGARQHQYPDRKIKEFEEKVSSLEKEYKRFVNKVFELDPSTTGVPWQARGYVSKRMSSEMKDVNKQEESQTVDDVKPKKICTPLLDNEIKERNIVVTQAGSQQTLQIMADVKSKPDVKGLLNLDYASSSEEDT